MNSWFKIQYLGLSRHSAIFFLCGSFFHQPLRWNHRQDLKRLVWAKLPEPSVSLRCWVGGKGGGTDLKRKGLDRFDLKFDMDFHFEIFLCGATEGEKTFRSSWWPSKELNFIVNSQLFCVMLALGSTPGWDEWRWKATQEIWKEYDLKSRKSHEIPSLGPGGRRGGKGEWRGKGV